MKHEPFGDVHIPFAEPSWHRGVPTPYYTKKHAEFRNKVRDWVQKNITPFAHQWDEQKSFPIVKLRKSAYAAGVLSPWAPANLGGTPPDGGWDEFMDVIWIQELSRLSNAGVVIVMFFITCMALPHVLRFGSKKLIDRVARPVIRGDAGICITLTEPQGGSDLANLRTTAVKTPDGKFYIVNGAKKFITGGSTATFFSTLVRTGRSGYGGLSIIIIDANLPGITVHRLKAQGWWAGNTTSVIFNDVKVPVENLIGKKEGRGFRQMVEVMNWERMIAVVSNCQMSRDFLREAIIWARQRKTFGKRLIEHQVIRHKIANMARRIEATHALMENFAFQIENGASVKDAGILMALGKVQATQTMEFCARETSQILGGASYLRQGKGLRVERMIREVRVGVVGGGSEEILIDLAMRQSQL